MAFTWYCFKKDIPTRSILEEILPENYKYKVKSFKILEKAEINVESKFEAHLSVNICSENYLRDFLSDFEKSSSTEYNILHGDERKYKKLVVSGVRKCHHYIRKRTKSGKVGKDEELAEPKTAGKDTGCPALIKFKLKKTDDHEHDDNCDFFPLEIVLKYDHNHSIESASALRFHNVSEETKKKFIELFKNDHSAASAYQDYKNHLMREHGNNFVKISADRAIMPDYKWVFSFHSIFIKEQFGKINSPEAYQKAVAKVKEYNDKREEVLCTIEQLDDGEVIVAVCDQLSKRVHQVLPQSGDIVYVDATSNLGRLQYLL